MVRRRSPGFINVIFTLVFIFVLISNFHSCAADTVAVKNAAGSSDRDVVMVHEIDVISNLLHHPILIFHRT
jgi:hypothetical protein